MDKFEDILALTSKTFFRTAMQNDASELDQAFGLIELGRGIRPYLYFSKVNLEDMWEKIRSSETLTTLILDSATLFHISLSHEGINPNTLIENCVSAFTLVSGTQTVVDEVLLKRTLKPKDGLELFQHNFWFIYLYLLGVATHGELAKVRQELVSKPASK